MDFVDKGDRMANSYSISRRTWKWTKKVFFHLMDVTVLNSFILSKSLGNEISHRMFRLKMVRDLLEKVGNWTETKHRWRPNPSDANITRLDAKVMGHWPEKTSKLGCHVCSTKKLIRHTNIRCIKCDDQNIFFPGFPVLFNPDMELSNEIVVHWIFSYEVDDVVAVSSVSHFIQNEPHRS
ncbi:hypothetical protein J437_LFUL016262 [Ladona fulva]|uniref:PiggyBac transposable element-derived protein domain-containing protein n=1 Tax=Ladona fulva TaxID=123851 RepID=A0A8K0P937_LADFU|nr:hypothetical protein J437_LFUL016262 [Ladona fulva]